MARHRRTVTFCARQFQISPTRYYQLLNDLLEKRAALEADPMLVKRLRRLRAHRQRARAAKRLGFEKPS